MQSVINNRYILHETLGQGAMGVVYRATDRLTGEGVALKSVTIPGEELQFASQASTKASAREDKNHRLALAQEFQTLASLRHPNIISVLDYGFDLINQPYFTMNYLVEACTILDAGKKRFVEGKVDLLIQLLQALTYLHRRNILHRDLKPGNILVTKDRVRVLDFGLSISREEAQGRTGTLAYMAPETLKHGQAVEASDLYAVGVIAYQLFASSLPFKPNDIMGVLSRPADMSQLDADSALVAIVEQLLQKTPSERFANAHQVIQALGKAIGKPKPTEDADVRESFLQAATFVGRDAELSQLINALEQAKNGNGSTWLIGSESGVGKTRLLEELRIRALVQGAQVLRGQATEGQGQPYQIWRSPFRRLALAVELNDLEAGVLKAILPDIENILDKEIPAIPELDEKEAAQRLFSTLTNVIKKAALVMPPLVLLLEDLHWALESLESLAALSRITQDAPLLVIGTYRIEDAPDLPASVPDMQTMILPRFAPQAIAALSASMLGESGAQPQIVQFLQNETEGNVFFLVETVRALAEETGSLQNITTATLPKAVFAGGVLRVIQRRLSQVPEKYQPILKLAAVAGRDIEPDVLLAAMPHINLENWLTACANVAVLEIHDERWRFAHDKLRESLLSSIRTEEQSDLHLQVARALEATFIDSLAPHYGRLAWHYAKANDVQKELFYAKLAGEQAASQYSNEEALRFFDRALELTPENDLETRYDLMLSREKIYRFLGKQQEQLENLENLQRITTALDDPARRADIAFRWAGFYTNQGSFPTAIEMTQKSLDLALSANEIELALDSYNRLVAILLKQNKFPEASKYVREGLELAQRNSYREIEATLINNLGMIAFHKRELAAARAYFEKSLSVLQKDEYPSTQALVFNNLGMIAGYEGKFQAALNYYEQALKITRKVGFLQSQAMNLMNLGWVSGLLGAYEKAIDYTKENIRISREIGDLYSEAYGLVNLSSYAGVTGDLETAFHAAQRAKEIAIQIGDRSAEAWAMTSLGHGYFADGKLENARSAYQEALCIRQELDQPLLGTEPAAGLARTLLDHGELEPAYQQVKTILAIIKQHKGLDGTDDPIRVYLACYFVLKAKNMDDATQILEEARDLILSKAQNITDPSTRKNFLEGIPQHQEVLIAWKKHIEKK
jgi:predicted ATPase